MGLLEKLGLRPNADNKEGAPESRPNRQKAKSRGPVEVYGSVQGSGERASAEDEDVEKKIRQSLS